MSTADIGVDDATGDGEEGGRPRPWEGGFWLSERAFPLFVAALAAGIFAVPFAPSPFPTALFLPANSSELWILCSTILSAGTKKSLTAAAR